MTRSVDRARLLADLGYDHPDAQQRAVEVLAEAKLTNPKKKGIAPEKRERVADALSRMLIRLCSRCIPGAENGEREPVPVTDATHCEKCGGSPNRLAVDQAVEACRKRGVRRVVVVGGAPGVHTALKELWPRDVELRVVSGTDRHTGRQAKANLDWADVVVVWATTELDHKVSLLYTSARLKKVVVARHRGIKALANRISAHVKAVKRR